MRFRTGLCATLALSTLVVQGKALAAERVTLRNGFVVSCDHRAMLDAEHVRLYLDAAATSYMDVPSGSIAASETEKATAAPAPVPGVVGMGHPALAGSATATDRVDDLIRAAGQARSLNLDLLRSVVQAESGGHIHAVSRAGAQGLMQLMPATARAMGVTDSFAPEQNLRGGTDYLDALLRRYHDDLALALAAYNAGPGAVDRYHGVPPFRETRLYVSRIIREFNRRSLLAQSRPAQVAAAAAAR